MKCPCLVEHQIAAFFHQSIHPRVLPLKLFSQRILLNSGSHYLQPVKEYIKGFVDLTLIDNILTAKAATVGF